MKKYALVLAGLICATSAYALGPSTKEVKFANLSNENVCVFINDEFAQQVKANHLAKIKVSVQGNFSLSASEVASLGNCDKNTLDSTGCKKTSPSLATVLEKANPKAEPKLYCEPSHFAHH